MHSYLAGEVGSEAEVETHREFGIKEAKNSLSQLVAAVQAGEEIYLMNRGEPVAKIVPVNVPTDGKSTKGRGMFKDKIHLPPGWATQKAREKAERDLLGDLEGL